MIYLSKSTVKSTLYCPLWYRLAKVDKLSPTKPSPSLVKGQIIHDFCSHFFSHFKVEDGMIKPTFFVEPSLKSQINNFIKVEQVRYDYLKNKNLPNNFSPILIEQEFESSFLGYEGKVNVFTYIDRLDKADNGHSDLVEIKGHPNPESDMWDLAFGMFCLGKDSVDAYDIKGWKVIYYGIGEEYKTDVDNSLMVKVQEDIAGVVDIILNQKFHIPAYKLPYFNAKRCIDFCQYNKYCGVKDITMEMGK